MNDESTIEGEGGCKRKDGHRSRAGAFGAVVIASIGVMVQSAFADEIPVPVLTLEPAGTNQFLISITNGVSYANYELYWQPQLNPAAPWLGPVESGAQGQTNFVVEAGITLSGFYRAAIGLDWDDDGSLNTEDGQPANPDVGALTVTIDSPVNGENID